MPATATFLICRVPIMANIDSSKRDSVVKVP
jgi:hypothetical protein